jgi:hypothetical protein
MRGCALAALQLLAGLALCSGLREKASVVTPKLLKLQQEQSERDASWNPVRRPRLA